MNVKDQEIFDPKKLRLARISSSLSGNLKPRRRSNLPIDKITIKKILVQEYQCIGDVIMLEPTLRSLKKGFPQAEIDLLCSPSVAKLATKCKMAHNILVYPHEIPYRKRYDLVFDFHGDVRRLKLLKSYRSKQRAGFNFSGGARWLTQVVDYPYQKHQVERPFDLLQKMDIPIITRVPKLDGFEPEPRISHRILLHPRANHKYRMWPAEHWVVLIGMLQAEGYEIIWINPPGGYCKLDIKQFSGDLSELAKLIQSAALLVGVDSMSGHLAAALGTPTLTIFGSQNSELTRPYHPNGHIIRPQRHCTHVKKDWRLCYECMNSIRAKNVREQIKKILK